MQDCGKIRRLKFTNFRGFEEAEIDLSDRIAVIIAPNDAGKSTLRAGLEYLLLGKTGEFSGDKRDDDLFLIRRGGAKKATLIGDIEGIGAVTRHVPNALSVEGFQGPITAQQVALLRQITGRDGAESALSHALNATLFFSERPAEQKEYLLGALGVEAGPDFREANIPAEHFAYLSKTVSRHGEMTDEKVHAALYERRRSINKEIDEARQALKTVTDSAAASALTDTASTKEEIEEKIGRLKSEKAAIYTRQAEETSAHERLAVQAGQIQSLGQQIAEMEPGGAGPDPVILPVKPAEGASEAALGEVKRLTAEVSTVQDEAAKLKGRIEELEKAAGDGVCAFLQETCERIGSDAIEGRVRDLVEQVTALEAKKAILVIEQQETVTKHVNAVNAQRLYDTAQEEQKKRIKATEKKAADITAKKATLQAKEAALQSARAAAKTGPDPTEALKALDVQIDSLQTDFLRARQRDEGIEKTVTLQAKIGEKTEEKGHLEYLLEALGPGGLRTKILAESLQGLLDTANTALQGFTGLRLAFERNEDVILPRAIVGWPSGDSTIPAKNLAHSAVLRASTALLHAICLRSGVPYLVIDNLESLDRDNRRAFLRMLYGLEGLHNIIVLFVQGETEPFDPGIPGIGFWTIRCGQFVRCPKKG